MRSLLCLVVLLILPCRSILAQEPANKPAAPAAKAKTGKTWPHPIPARIRDGSNKDLFVMTLGDVNTALADGTFDPSKDEVTLKDGSVMKNYYRDTLRRQILQADRQVDFSLAAFRPLHLVLLLSGRQRERGQAQRRMDRPEPEGLRRAVRPDRRRLAGGNQRRAARIARLDRRSTRLSRAAWPASPPTSNRSG